MQRLLLLAACLMSGPALACSSVATTSPRPPAADGLYPARLVRVDSRPVNLSTTTEMFQGLRLNDGAGSRQIFAPPPQDTTHRSQFPLKAGAQRVEVVEAIPDGALSRAALRDRRKMNNPRSKTVLIDVVPGQRYAIAARLLQADAAAVHSNEYWEPVVWQQQDVGCDR